MRWQNSYSVSLRRHLLRPATGPATPCPVTVLVTLPANGVPLAVAPARGWTSPVPDGLRQRADGGADHYRVRLLQGGTVIRDRTTSGTSWGWTPPDARVTYQWQVAAVAASGKVGTYTAPRGFTAGADA